MAVAASFSDRLRAAWRAFNVKTKPDTAVYEEYMAKRQSEFEEARKHLSAEGRRLADKYAVPLGLSRDTMDRDEMALLVQYIRCIDKRMQAPLMAKIIKENPKLIQTAPFHKWVVENSGLLMHLSRKQ